MIKENNPISLRFTPSLRKNAPSKVKTTNKGIPEAKPVHKQIAIFFEKISLSNVFLDVEFDNLKP